MNDNYIKNREGRIIGRMIGQWTVDRGGRLVARYDSSSNKTFTREGRIIGSGDLRLFQIGKERPAK